MGDWLIRWLLQSTVCFGGVSLCAKQWMANCCDALSVLVRCAAAVLTSTGVGGGEALLFLEAGQALQQRLVYLFTLGLRVLCVGWTLQDRQSVLGITRGARAQLHVHVCVLCVCWGVNVVGVSVSGCPRPSRGFLRCRHGT